ncbi:MAG: c-type cytochrome [Terriglobia bacterium]
MRRAGISAGIAALTLICVYSGTDYRAQTAPADAAAVARGQKLFVSSCGFCHGADATGARGPDLVRSKLVADDAGGNLIGEVIRSGRPQGGMPAFNMPADQIADIAAFLQSRVMASKHSRAMGGGYPLSRLLTGNSERGKAYFDGAGGCTACHSTAGDLAHVAGKYSPLSLELRMLYPRGGAPSTVTVTEPSGATVTGRLVRIDEFAVALRDDSGWYRSFSRSRVKVEVHDPLEAHRRLLDKITQDQMHNLFAYLETLK